MLREVIKFDVKHDYNESYWDTDDCKKLEREKIINYISIELVGAEKGELSKVLLALNNSLNKSDMKIVV